MTLGAVFGKSLGMASINDARYNFLQRPDMASINDARYIFWQRLNMASINDARYSFWQKSRHGKYQ